MAGVRPLGVGENQQDQRRAETIHLNLSPEIQLLVIYRGYPVGQRGFC